MPINFDKMTDEEIDRDLGIKPQSKNHLRTFLAKWNKRLGIFLYPFKLLYLALTFPVFPTLSIARAVNGPLKRSILRRCSEGFFTRIILTPILLAAFLLLFVWYTTHPSPILATQTPGTLGLYYRPVSLVSIDSQHLQGWYVPGFNADEIIRNGDDALKDRRPGVVLVHGLGLAHDEYLVLASQLHEAGFCVLMLSLRGQGESEPAAITFGLRERYDVLAGVNYLRDLPQVDSSKVCVVGHDMAAMAALGAALSDSSIAAVVAEAPWQSFSDWTRHNFDRPGVPTGVLTDLYQAAFELAYRERTSQLDLAATLRHMRHTGLLLITRNQADEAPSAAVYNAANAMPGPHQVLVVDPHDERSTPRRLAATVTNFLVESIHWTPSDKRLSENLHKLIDARIH